MADASTVKVFHAARQDIEFIYLKAEIVPAPVFDTQVAAMVCGYGDSISYVNLVKKRRVSISTRVRASPIGAGGHYRTSSSTTRSPT